uniref:THAP-type domain-containing protein n=1 Tax=Cyprinus carpio carpio TaxID=630221 RepID=A0A9J8AKM8_CYPCA
MSSVICSVRGCHNNWIKRREQLHQQCYEHNVKQSECCGEHLRQWRKALNLKRPPKRPYVCSYHFMDRRLTDKHPSPEKWLGYDVPVKKSRRVLKRLSDSDVLMTTSDAVDNCEGDHIHVTLNCDAETQWEDPSVSDHNYSSKSQLNLKPPTSDMGTQCTEPEALYIILLRKNNLCQLYTALHIAEHLTRSSSYTNSFQLHTWDQILMTLMKLRLNLLQGDLAERLGVSRSIVSKVVSCWIDIMEENMRDYIPWLPREKIQATMPQCFKEQFPNTTCVIDCSETPLQKPRNLDSRGESYSHYYGQNTIKYLVSIAPCGLIMFISPAYGGRCSDKFITANSGFLEYLRPGDEVMVKLVIPAFTKRGMQLSEEDTTNTRRIANICVHVERVICRLKNFKILSQTVPINLTPKIDKILRICATLCNLRSNIISDVADE